MTPIDILYLLVVGFIRVIKWIELQFLWIFSRWITKKVVRFGEKSGIVFHFTDETYKNWSPLDEEKALTKCSKYDNLVHIRVIDKSCFLDMANQGPWGVGEGFVNEKWKGCKDEGDVVHFVRRFLENDFLEMYYIWWNQLWSDLEFEVFNLQKRSRATQVTKKHYDLGNDIYEAMLDPWMQYTCAYWANADNLNDAQLHKLELIAKKLNLKPGMRVLDLGCGWGMLSKYLAERHGVQCVGVNISTEGIEYGRKSCEGLPVEFLLQDYRDKIKGTFDRVVAIGLMEHVGRKNHKEFFQIASKHLKEDGIFLCHTIGINHNDLPRSERWLCTHIFPNGCLPKMTDITNATEGLFIVEDWHNFGPDYAKTLAVWRENFKQNWPALKGNYGTKFYRTWTYYLTHCEGAFLSRKFQLWQIVLSKNGLKEPYRAAR